MGADRTVRFTTRSRDATIAAGRALGRLLKSGDTVAMDGDLGAGKTTMTAGIAEGVGCTGPVSSPTFVLAMEHAAAAGGLAMRHMDLYRLSDSQEFLEAGLDESFGNVVNVVEWAQIAREFLPEDRIRVAIRMCLEDEREIEIEFYGPDGLIRAESLNRLLTGIPGVGIERSGEGLPV